MESNYLSIPKLLRFILIITNASVFKFLSLAWEPYIVITTTSCVTGDDRVGILINLFPGYIKKCYAVALFTELHHFSPKRKRGEKPSRRNDSVITRVLYMQVMTGDGYNRGYACNKSKCVEYSSEDNNLLPVPSLPRWFTMETNICCVYANYRHYFSVWNKNGQIWIREKINF